MRDMAQSVFRGAPLKYRQAGYGFFISNTLYLIIVFIFLPSFHLDFSTIASFVIYLLIIGVLSFYISKGKRVLSLIVAVIFGARSLVSTYTLITGQAFEAIPFVLPLLVATFYLLGRATWDWP